MWKGVFSAGYRNMPSMHPLPWRWSIAAYMTGEKNGPCTQKCSTLWSSYEWIACRGSKQRNCTYFSLKFSDNSGVLRIDIKCPSCFLEPQELSNSLSLGSSGCLFPVILSFCSPRFFSISTSCDLQSVFFPKILYSSPKLEYGYLFGGIKKRTMHIKIHPQG